MWAQVGNNPFDLVIFAAAVLAAALFMFGAVRAAVRFLRRVGHFLDDWQGQEERPGFPARPGVMERLQGVEDRTRQLKPNGGSHLADKIAVIEARGEAIENRVTAIGEQLHDRERRLTQLEELRKEKTDEHAELERRIAALEAAIATAVTAALADEPAPAPTRRRGRKTADEPKAG